LATISVIEFVAKQDMKHYLCHGLSSKVAAFVVSALVRTPLRPKLTFALVSQSKAARCWNQHGSDASVNTALDVPLGTRVRRIRLSFVKVAEAV
jgi:hypothetical protein